MAYTTRVLERSEWARLAGTDADGLWPHLPETARVVVVESAERVIVGCWILLSVAHVECLWIAPTHRKRTGVARRLLNGMRTLTASMGIRRVMTAAVTEDVRTLLYHAGAEQVPGTHYMLDLQ